jgi:hypothetical protein
VAAVFECLGIANSGHYCSCGHHPYAWDGCDLLAHRGLFHDCFKPFFRFSNLSFDFAEPIERHAQQRLAANGQLALCLLEDFRDRLLESCWRSVYGDASFGEQTPHLIGGCGALLHQQLARSVNGLNVLLLNGLHLHEVHARAAGCLDDRLCIVAIVRMRAVNPS